jgi:oxygen-independent coproporphyrinogen-3 oxidase
MDRLGVYIHIPFCARKCPYCDFYSTRYNKETVSLYVDSLIRNFRAFSLENGKKKIVSVYFGGGTPILLADEIADILGQVKLVKNAEVTVEANPCVSDEKRLSTLISSGVNRISFGVQSMNEDELVFLGRRHTAGQAAKAIELAYRAGFRNISADLMLGLENQTEENCRILPHPKFELYRDRAGAYRFRLKARNGKIVGISESYATKTGAQNGIESVKINAAQAETEG